MRQPGLRAPCKLNTHHEILTRSIVELTSSEELWQFVTDTISFSAAALHCSSASLFLFDEEVAQLRLALVIENSSPLDLLHDSRLHELLFPFPAEELELWKEAVLSRKPCWQDVSGHSSVSQPWLSPKPGSSEREKVLGIPLNLHSQLIGLCCFRFDRDLTPENEQVTLINTLGGQVALAIQFLRISDQVLEVKKLRQNMTALKKAHEQLAQCLATISLYLAAAESQVTKKPSIATDAVRKAQELSQHGMKLARDTNSVLVAGRNDPENLSAVLRSIAQGTEEDLGVTTQFLEYGRPLESIPSEVTKALAGVVREAIENGVRHGRASRIVVTLSWYVEKLSVHIADNGSGFDLSQVEQVNEGYGISGMHDQARCIRGRVEVNSIPGRGTEIRCTVPIVNL